MKDNILHSILTERNLKKAILLIRQKQSEGVLPNASSSLEDIENDYGLMCNFLQRGFRDKQADIIYQGLLKKTYKLYAHLRLEHLKTTVRTFVEAASHAYDIKDHLEEAKQHLEEYVQDTAFLSLSDDISNTTSETNIYDRHQTFMDNTFNSVLLSDYWSEELSVQIEKILLSPTIDTRDVELIVSAITLACITIFDSKKWKALTTLYTDCTDEHIRQRALVGWMLAIPQDGELAIPEIRKKLENISQAGKHRKEILELQIQLFYCCSTDEDNRIIQDDILPTLIKNNNLHITRSGLMERDDDDAMNDIIDPENADREIENLEKTFERMKAMQKAGSDIYFGGFSQMKRFTFFYKLSNWFCPYYPQHPQIASAIKKIGNDNSLTSIMSDGIFCDSDKYSFVLGLSSIIDKLPANIHEMMANSMDAAFIQGDNDTQQPAYIRRSYLQDLYRFFNLFQNKNDFSNPFKWNTSGGSFFFTMDFCKDLLQDERDKLAIFFYKRHRYNDILALYENVSLPISREAKVVLAQVCLRTGHIDKAQTIFNGILSATPSDECALRGLARIDFAQKRFEQAEIFYEKLQSEHQESIKYKLNLAITRLHLNKISQGMDLLYRLYYEHPEQKDVKRALAWGCLIYKKTSEADKIYNSLISEEEPLPTDYLNSGYAKWILSKIPEAVSMFRKYLSISNEKDYNKIGKDFDNDKQLLSDNGIGWAEKMIMLDLISGK